MAKLNFDTLSQKAIKSDTSLKSEAANRKRIIDNVYAYAFETSREGIGALLGLAHLSLVSEGCPSEVPLKNGFQSTGREPVLLMDSNGNWSASLTKKYDGPEQRATSRFFPGRSNWVSLADAIAAAADIPSVGNSAETIRAALNPVKDRDFDHFADALDRIPLRTLSAMLGEGPQLASGLGLGLKNSNTSHIVDGEWYPDVEYTDDVAKLSRCIGDAMFRRMAPVADHGMELDHMIAEVKKSMKDPHVLREMQIPKPTCMAIFAPYTPVETIKDFLHQAVRVGFDINALDGRAGYGGLPTAAHRAVTLLTLKDLDATVTLGLDLEFADNLSSLTDTVIDGLSEEASMQALPMLKHLVNKYGLSVSKESYEKVTEALGEAYQMAPWYREDKEEERKREKRIHLLKATIVFLDEKFSHLQTKKKRKAA
jgi:hypothetical protein